MKSIEKEIVDLFDEVGKEELAPWCDGLVKEGLLGHIATAQMQIDYACQVLESYCDFIEDIEEVGDRVVEIED